MFLISSHKFKCSLDYAKRAFYHAANAIFGKVARVASEEVVLHLVKSKCYPVLLYGLEACMLNKDDLRSINFTATWFFMTLFRTSNSLVIADCQFFGTESPSVRLEILTCKFVARYKSSDNNMCKLFKQLSCELSFSWKF